MSSYYGSLENAELYMAGRLMTAAWGQATVTQREAALTQSTRTIDLLNFAGSKTNSGQELQFPRDDDTVVPTEIEYACYEEALSLLDGNNPEILMQSLTVTSDAFSGVRATYNSDFAPPHILCGLTSAIAFNYLRPYIRLPGGVRISRGS